MYDLSKQYGKSTSFNDDDLFDDIEKQAIKSREMVNTVERSSRYKTQLNSLSPAKRKAFNKFRFIAN